MEEMGGPSKRDDGPKIPGGAVYDWYRQRILLGVAIVVIANVVVFGGLVAILRACS